MCLSLSLLYLTTPSPRILPQQSFPETIGGLEYPSRTLNWVVWRRLGQPWWLEGGEEIWQRKELKTLFYDHSDRGTEEDEGRGRKSEDTSV